MFNIKKVLFLFISCSVLQTTQCYDIKAALANLKARATDKQTVHTVKHAAKGITFGCIAATAGYATVLNLFDTLLASDEDSSRYYYGFNMLATSFVAYKAAKAAKENFSQIKICAS